MLVVYGILEWYFIFAVLPFLLFYVYSQSKMTDLEYSLELMGNVNDYLSKVLSTKGAEEETNFYHLQMAYAAIYKDDMESLLEHIHQVDMESLPHPHRYHPIYIRTRARACKEEQDLETLEQLDAKATEMDIPNVQGYIRLMKLLVQEQYEDAITLINDLLKMQRVRLHAVELEYWLAKCRLETGETEIAIAILEIIVRKGLNVEFTEWAYDTYIQLNENN
jgi:hypothetical protein